MAKRINIDVKFQMIGLAGACFWYWNSFYSFLESSGVPRQVYQRYPKESYNKYDVMRNILNDLEEGAQSETINALISNFFSLKNAVDSGSVDNIRAKKLLQEFRSSVGNDPIEAAIKKKEQEQAQANHQQVIEGTKFIKSKLASLNLEFQNLVKLIELTPQQRGFKFEELFFEILHLAEFEINRPYRTKHGEQIDGHFKFDKFDYLVEVKWTSGPTKQKDLSIFDGKIRGKAQSTRGLFLAAEGFDENAIIKFSGDAPRIILMTGEDLALVLDGSVLTIDVMKAKSDAIVRYGDINFPARNILN